MSVKQDLIIELYSWKLFRKYTRGNISLDVLNSQFEYFKKNNKQVIQSYVGFQWNPN